jgi:hypothetical protein
VYTPFGRDNLETRELVRLVAFSRRSTTRRAALLAWRLRPRSLKGSAVKITATL